MRYLRQSTVVTVVVGPLVSKDDGITPKTALADQSANARLVKNGTGAAFTAASWAHDAFGHYLIELGTAHTDTVGRLRLSFSDPTTFCPIWEDFTVLQAAVFDWLFGAVAPLNAALLVPVRNQDAITAPNVGDALLGAWSEAFGKQSVAGTAFVKRTPDNAAALRTFTLTIDATTGKPTARD